MKVGLPQPKLKQLRQGFLLPPMNFPILNFPTAISLFPHGDLRISKKVFSMRHDLETIFFAWLFLGDFVIICVDGCVFHHLHLI